MTAPPSLLSGLAPTPAAVAIVGATPSSFFARSVVENLLRYGYRGRILPVGPGGRPVAGVEGIADIDDLPCEVDLGVVAVGAPRCLDACRSLVANGATAVVVVSDGFSETGSEEGRDREAELAGWCAEHGVLLLGPNGVGFADFHRHLACIGLPITADVLAGPVSLISQSGGMVSSILAGLAEEGAGVDLAVSIGNGAGYDLLDAIEDCVARPATEVVVAYVESVGTDVTRLVDLLDRLAVAGKRLVLVKPGRTATSRQLVASHTASLAGPDELVRALLSDHRVAVVDTVEQLVRTARLALGVASLSARRAVAVVGAGGGAASIAADMAAAHRVPLAAYAEATVQALRPLVPVSGHVGNPLDLSGGSGGGRVDLDAVYGIIAHDPSVAAFLLPYSGTVPDRSPSREPHRAYLVSMAQIAARHGVPLVVATIAGQPIGGWLRQLEAEHPGTMVLRGLDATMAGLRALTAGTATDERAHGDGASARDPTNRRGAIGLADDQRQDPSILDVWQSRGVVADAGLAMVEGRRLDLPLPEMDGPSPTPLAVIVSELGAPLVAKGVLPGVAHKAAVGGVALGLCSSDDVRSAVAAMAEATSLAGCPLEGVVLERMITGVELIVGLTRHAVYGPSVTLGLGGMLAETTPLHATAALPWSDRGGPGRLVEAAGLQAVVDASGVAPHHLHRVLATVCRSFVDGPLAVYDTVEINPVFLTTDGEVLGADALVATKTHDPRPTEPTKTMTTRRAHAAR